ncbi:MAG: phosphomannomutase/phosphoglucomutase, partial [Phycicoccus sp.]
MTSRSLTDVVKAYDIRGTVPDQFDPEVARALGVGFADVVVRADDGRGCLVARDMRDSGPSLVAAFADGLRSRGVDV